MESDVYIIALLITLIAISEWLVTHTRARHVGTALLVILLGAIASNAGLLPSSSSIEEHVPVYDFIFNVVAPLSVFWLLLGVNLKDIRKAGMPIITLFLIGSAGTAIGVVITVQVLDIQDNIGPMYKALAGMLTGTYTGGSINFNALAIHYNAMEDGVLFAGTVVADNIVTALWMVATLAIPVILSSVTKKIKSKEHVDSSFIQGKGEEEENIGFDVLELSILLGLAFGTLFLSEWIRLVFLRGNLNIPVIIILTIIALILAQWKGIARLRMANGLGMFSVYLFLVVIGAHCDIVALIEAGHLGITLLLFTSMIVFIHGTIIYSTALLLRWDIRMASIASQANIGGGPTALAVAKSLGRNDLTLPAIIIGSLGNALGTFLGFWIAGVV